MGGGNSKYVKSLEDQLESYVRKGLNLREIHAQLPNVDKMEIFRVFFEPNRWNIFHLACWYSNVELLRDLISQEAFSTKDLVNMPDRNGEPPVVLACMMDDVKILQFMVEEAKCLIKFDNAGNKYRENLSLDDICIVHDAFNCFTYLYPDLNEENARLDMLYDLAKNKNSENIVKAFEKDKIDLDFDFELFAENEPNMINL